MHMREQTITNLVIVQLHNLGIEQALIDAWAPHVKDGLRQRAEFFVGRADGTVGLYHSAPGLASSCRRNSPVAVVCLEAVRLAVAAAQKPRRVSLPEMLDLELDDEPTGDDE